MRAHPDCITTRKPGVALDRIVLHTMEGTLAGSVAWATRSRAERAASFQRRLGGTLAGWMADSRTYPTAAHYYIGKDGKVVQLVDDWQKCAHAGNYNSRSLGIEHEAKAGDPGAWTPLLLVTSARIVRVLCNKYDIPIDRTHIVGHNEVPGATHTDPGKFFPWDEYLDLVANAHVVG